MYYVEVTAEIWIKQTMSKYYTRTLEIHDQGHEAEGAQALQCRAGIMKDRLFLSSCRLGSNYSCVWCIASIRICRGRRAWSCKPASVLQTLQRRMKSRIIDSTLTAEAALLFGRAGWPAYLALNQVLLP